MNAYIYRAALYCEDCADKIKRNLPIPPDVENESSFDSDEYPKGPYPDGGGEADYPQHCESCEVFLENPLTDDGYDYVINGIVDLIDGAFTDWRNVNAGNTSTLESWFNFYNLKVTR